MPRRTPRPARPSIAVILLIIAGLVEGVIVSSFVRVPGYVDAEYYFDGGINLAGGKGWKEPYLWNYLDNPDRLPHPAFSYWMPLSALISAAGIWINGSADFQSARWLFTGLAALLPVLTYQLGRSLHGDNRLAIWGGVFALAPGFYLPYLYTTDTFTPGLWLGCLFFLLVLFEPVGTQEWIGKGLLLGVLAGLFHLNRADGILWLVAAWLACVFPLKKKANLFSVFADREIWLVSGFVAAGYLVVMSPWLIRNLSEWGRLLPPGGSRTIWLTGYEQTFSYTLSVPGPQTFFNTAPADLIKSRLEALLTNLQSFVAVQGEIILFPFMVYGIWLLRKNPAVRVGAGMWIGIFCAMSFLFPFAGTNGGFFHSSAAIQCLFWAVAPLGVDQFVVNLARLRRWTKIQPMKQFFFGLIILTCTILSLVLTYRRVVGNDSTEDWAWERDWNHYQQVEEALALAGAKPGEVVMTNNPPGYFSANRRPAVVIPFGPPEDLYAAADRFGVRYLVLELNNPYQLRDFYDHPGSQDGLVYLGDVGSTRLFEVKR